MSNTELANSTPDKPPSVNSNMNAKPYSIGTVNLIDPP